MLLTHGHAYGVKGGLLRMSWRRGKPVYKWLPLATPMWPIAKKQTVCGC